MFNKTVKQQQQSLQKFIILCQSDKTISTPINYQYHPVEVISKEFTKFNSHYAYKIHYLGPRPASIEHLHKKYGRNSRQWWKEGNQGQQESVQLFGVVKFAKYGLDMKKIISCNLLSDKIFEVDQSKQIFYRAFEGMNPSLIKTEQYIFNSAFEAANLDCVIKVEPNEYDLFLRIDSNSRGHMSWYYFSVKNNKQLSKVKFNICNLRKPSLLYQSGMRPYVFSKRQWMLSKKEWAQGGNECFYQQRPLRFNFIYDKLTIMERYILTFSYQFTHEDDEVFFAYCIPYTYSELQYNILTYKTSDCVKIDILGRTLCGLDIPVINISNHQIDPSKKRTIVITGRVHPAQSNSSHVVNGLINFLLSNDKAAIELINNNNFFIVPMLNPDGVILGNTRTSLSGKDLNRVFNRNNKQLYPEIFYLKGFLYKLHKQYKIFMYLDFHGHSRKKSTFSYGPNYPINHSQYEKSRLFPKLIERNNNVFRFYGSSFVISQDKLSTARAVMLNEYRILYVFTIQSSIGLYYDPDLFKTLQFSKQSWYDIGIAIMNGLNTFVILLNHQQQQSQQKRQQKVRTKQKMQQNKNSQAVNNVEGNQLKVLYNQLIDEISKESQFNFQNEISSDDHNQSEDMDVKKQGELNYFYKQSNTKDGMSSKKQFIEDFVSFSSSNLIDRPVEKSSIRKNQTFHTQNGKKTPQKKNRTIIYSQNVLQKDGNSQASKQDTSNKANKNGLNMSQSKTFQPIYKQKCKSILRQNYKRERYNLATTTFFPCNIHSSELQILPQNIKIMRTELKKGRNLINFFEQSKKKYDHQKMIYESLPKEDRRYSFLSTKTQVINSRCLKNSKHISVPDYNSGIKSKKYIGSERSGSDLSQGKKEKSVLTIRTMKSRH